MRDARGGGGDRIGSDGRTGVDACGSAPMDATREMDGTGRDGTGRTSAKLTRAAAAGRREARRAPDADAETGRAAQESALDNLKADESPIII